MSSYIVEWLSIQTNSHVFYLFTFECKGTKFNIWTLAMFNHMEDWDNMHPYFESHTPHGNAWSTKCSEVMFKSCPELCSHQQSSTFFVGMASSWKLNFLTIFINLFWSWGLDRIHWCMITNPLSQVHTSRSGKYGIETGFWQLLG